MNANGQPLAYVYFEEEPGRRTAASCSPVTRAMHFGKSLRFKDAPRGLVDQEAQRKVVLTTLLPKMTNPQHLDGSESAQPLQSQSRAKPEGPRSIP